MSLRMNAITLPTCVGSFLKIATLFGRTAVRGIVATASPLEIDLHELRRPLQIFGEEFGEGVDDAPRDTGRISRAVDVVALRDREVVGDVRGEHLRLDALR